MGPFLTEAMVKKIRDPLGTPIKKQARPTKELTRKDTPQEAVKRAYLETSPTGAPLGHDASNPYSPAKLAPGLMPLVGITEEMIKADFRLFVILLWRHLLGVDPAPIMLDMAGYLQHGPDRCVINAFRGFSKSWITGAYALWRLYKDPQQKILVVSGSLTRAIATTQWCLMLILTWPLLQHLRPRPDQRQSSKAFDVGPAFPDQSPSFHALGIGGQIVGFRGDCIIPDDVETQTNSITPVMREKTSEAVKEYDSVLKPAIMDEHGNRRTDVLQPCIKFLGTPHDEDSLYAAKKLPQRGYDVRVWPALFPTKEQIKTYGNRLAPYILRELEKNPKLVGTPTMPSRFSMEELEKRRLSLGNSEFALQFMLDTSLSDANKYPLKLRDLMVMALDARRGPTQVTWSNDLKHRINDLQPMGFDGDFYFEPAMPPEVTFMPYEKIVGAVDTSGRGEDEVSLTIGAGLHGTVFLLYAWAKQSGYDEETLKHIANMCVLYKVQKLRIESNFGDGMFAALLRPVLEQAWKAWTKLHPGDDAHGTEIEEVKASNTTSKEKRILSVLEPITQQHRLVVNKQVVEWDFNSLQEIEGEDTRHRYALFHQYTHLTREKDSLKHDDRLDSLAIMAADFAEMLGVNPEEQAKQSAEDKYLEEFEKLYGESDGEDDYGLPTVTRTQGARPSGMGVTRR